ncbi:MAG: prepilin-type N-terminal cleavage/methylation domain-containing protein [Proteobacteria bacterium]|nr:MAG: prepilin-type N-terminal cleavage/methylation domain-containing protein [Pseudomonadota bacterium]
MSARVHRQGGMTLIELVIVMLIVAILAGIAIPTYRAQVVKVRRADAKVELARYSQTLERCYTRFNRYDDAQCNTGLPRMSAEGGYIISINNLTDQTYLLTATPQGPQISDTRCANFMLDHLGTKTTSGTAPVSDCW